MILSLLERMWGYKPKKGRSISLTSDEADVVSKLLQEYMDLLIDKHADIEDSDDFVIKLETARQFYLKFIEFVEPSR